MHRVKSAQSGLSVEIARVLVERVVPHARGAILPPHFTPELVVKSAQLPLNAHDRGSVSDCVVLDARAADLKAHIRTHLCMKQTESCLYVDKRGALSDRLVPRTRCADEDRTFPMDRMKSTQMCSKIDLVRLFRPGTVAKA